MTTQDQLRQALEDVCNPISYLKRRAEAEGKVLGGMAYGVANDIATVQQIASDALAAAPKVASDTGAGLREAAIRGALCLSGFAGEGICVDGFEDPADAWTRIAMAVGLPDGDDDDLRKALATPTDATDGATGGGEVERLRAEVAYLTGAPAGSGASDCRAEDVDAAILRCRAQGDDATAEVIGRMRMAYATLAATTPGGDLLEQAALVEEWEREKRDWRGNTPLIDRTIRALSAGNLTDDGGVKHGVR